MPSGFGGSLVSFYLPSTTEAGPVEKVGAIVQTARRDFAGEFARLALRFEETASRETKPQWLGISIQQIGAQCGRVTQDAADAGILDRHPGWRNAEELASLHKQEGDAERFGFLWTACVGQWLEREHPSRLRHAGGAWDWKHIAKDNAGRPLDKDRKPVSGRWYRNGKALPRGTEPNLRKTKPNENFTWRRDAELAYESDFYNESDAMSHLRIQAEVYADACRLLAELLCTQQTSMDRGECSSVVVTGAKAERENHQQAEQASIPDAKGYVADPVDPSAFVPAAEIVTLHTPADIPLTAKQLRQLLENYAANQIRWTRPKSKDGKPRYNRLNVHLTDWVAHVQRRSAGSFDTDGGGWPPVSEDEVAETKDKIRRKQSDGK